MPQLIGNNCYSDYVPGSGGGTAPGPGGGGTTPVPVVSGSAVNEIVAFTNLSKLTLAWNTTRIAKFGPAPVFNVYVIGEDSKYRLTDVEVIPDNIIAPTKFDFDFGGSLSGIIIIS